MIEELKDEQLLNKVGGRFKLSALIQRRLVYLNKGARAFVDVDQPGDNKLRVVIQEILQDKIYLDLDGNVQERGESLDSIIDTEFTDGV